jgi:hypothetical protein
VLLLGWFPTVFVWRVVSASRTNAKCRLQISLFIGPAGFSLYCHTYRGETFMVENNFEVMLATIVRITFTASNIELAIPLLSL